MWLQLVVAASATHGGSPHLVNVEHTAAVDIRVLVGHSNLLLGQLGRHLCMRMRMDMHTHTRRL